MTPSSLAGHVVELLDRIVKTDLPADKTISDFYRQRKYLGSHDRRWITDKIYGIIRNFLLLKEIGRELNPDSRALRTFLIYEILFAGMKVEEIRNVYSQLLESYRMAGTDVDLEELSNRSTHKLEMLKNDEDEFVLNSFPDFFSDLLPSNVRSEYVPMMRALNHEARVCIRVDAGKISRDEAMESLHKEGVNASFSDFSPLGIYLSKRVNLNSMEHLQKWDDRNSGGSKSTGRADRKSAER